MLGFTAEPSGGVVGSNQYNTVEGGGPLDNPEEAITHLNIPQSPGREPHVCNRDDNSYSHITNLQNRYRSKARSRKTF